MYLNGKRIEDVTSSDITRLISNEVAENKILEYKKELKFDARDDKKEFLYDITSMANTEGGIIIFGIEEAKDSKGQNTGIPKEIVGLVLENEDKLKQQIEDTLRNNIEPKLMGFNIRILNVNEKKILIISINKSLTLPHMVTFNSSNKFYKRKMTGKYLLDVYELSNAFGGSMALKEKANNFRENRVSEVMTSQFYSNINVENSFFLHIVPLGRLEEIAIDITDPIKADFLRTTLIPINASGWDYLYNIEGLMAIAEKRQQQSEIYSYIQIFRDCSLEFYTNTLYRTEESRKLFDGFQFEEMILNKIIEAYKVFNLYQIEPPFAIFISLFGMKGSQVYVHYPYNNYSRPINKEKILLPAIVLNDIFSGAVKDIKTQLHPIMKPVFDIFWQMAGYAESPYTNVQR